MISTFDSFIDYDVKFLFPSTTTSHQPITMSLIPNAVNCQTEVGQIKETPPQQSLAVDNSDIFNGDGQQSFYRSASFMDISRQTTENELSITLRKNDTLMDKISPAMSRRLIKVTFYLFIVHSHLINL